MATSTPSTPTVEDYLVFSALSYALADGQTPAYVGWTVQSSASSGGSPTFIDPNGEVWTIVDQTVSDNGVTAYAFANTQSQIVIAYRGSITSHDWTSEDITLAGGVRPDQDFNQAQDFASQLTQNPQYSDYTFFVTGHSIGGAEAEDVAASLDIGGATFAAPGVSNLLLSNNRTGSPAPTQVLTNYVVSTDLVGQYADDTVGSPAALCSNRHNG